MQQGTWALVGPGQRSHPHLPAVLLAPCAARDEGFPEYVVWMLQHIRPLVAEVACCLFQPYKVCLGYAVYGVFKHSQSQYGGLVMSSVFAVGKELSVTYIDKGLRRCLTLHVCAGTADTVESSCTGSCKILRVSADASTAQVV